MIETLCFAIGFAFGGVFGMAMIVMLFLMDVEGRKKQ